jgi:hypothetical protein
MPLSIIETPYHSLKQGGLPEGCKGCVKGEKLVLFVTGVCPATCFFCPISEEKKNKDVMYANEQELAGTPEEHMALVIDEAKAHKATGAGITGGDPLARLERTCKYIRALKREFGKEFHIHLYTPLILVNDITMAKLYEAGLDEIRFHPSLQSEKFWPRMAIARKYNWKIGIEIPIFPDKVEETKRLIDFAAKEKVTEFLNLNELEISERTIEEFEKRNYKTKRSDSYAIEGSKDAALAIMRHAQQYAMPVHFCTTVLKDRVQMGNRIIRRAENTALPFDEVDGEGLLTRGAVYFDHLPGFAYNKRLKSLTKEQRAEDVDKLLRVLAWLTAQGMPSDAGVIDAHRLRVLLSAEALRELAPDMKKRFPAAKPAVVTEYPTSDSFIVELEKL